jgi:hypothetical protein
MRQYLVIAHRTLGGAHLMEHLRDLRARDPYCRFHLVVPRRHRPVGPSLEVDEIFEAQAVLDTVLDQMAAMGIGSTGHVGDPNPVVATGDAIRRIGIGDVTGIIVSTLPKRTSAWIRGDVPDRITKAWPLLSVSHVIAEDALV